MVLETLSKLWNTVRALRQLDKATPEALRVSAAKHAAKIKARERQAQESAKASSQLTEVMDARIQEAKSAAERMSAARQQAFQEKLNTIKIDPAAVQQKAVTDLLSKWEGKLEEAGVDRSARANLKKGLSIADKSSSSASSTTSAAASTSGGGANGTG